MNIPLRPDSAAREENLRDFLESVRNALAWEISSKWPKSLFCSGVTECHGLDNRVHWLTVEEPGKSQMKGLASANGFVAGSLCSRRAKRGKNNRKERVREAELTL